MAKKTTTKKTTRPSRAKRTSKRGEEHPPPDDLLPHGQRLWRELRPRLPKDSKAELVELLHQYCQLHDDVRMHREMLGTSGHLAVSKNGVAFQHPSVGMLNRALDNIRRHFVILKPYLGDVKAGGFVV